MTSVLTLQNRPEELARLSAWVAAEARAAACSERDAFRLDLALTEAVTNIIEHAFPEGGTHEISLQLEAAPENLTVALTDGGRPFDPLAGPPKALPTRLDEAQPGGLGIHLIRQYCDACRYERLEAGNRLTLVFQRLNLGLLRSHRLLAGIPAAQLEALAAKCRLVVVAPGEVLLTPGRENHTLYFLLSGRLQVHLDSQDSANTFPILPGEIIGEMSIIEGRPVLAWVVGAEPTQLLAMDETVFWSEFLLLPNATRQLLQLLIARARKTNAVLLQELERKAHYAHLQRELASAGKIQANILPALPLVPNHPQVEALAFIKAAREVGGDFFDALALNEHRVAFAVGDVSGKGMPAALFMVRVLTLLRQCLLTEERQGEVLSKLNRLLCEANDELMFVTLAVVILDTRTGQLTYLNAGHNPPFLSINGQPFSLWDPPPGTLLGIQSTARYSPRELRLSPGDTVVLYTDGVTEAENAERQLFQTHRAAAALNRSGPHGNLVELIHGLEQSLVSFAGNEPQSDDITVLAIRYLGESEPAPGV
jgi:sigma-B regulation protein RsbU (phosphoserine phosphatase)